MVLCLATILAYSALAETDYMTGLTHYVDFQDNATCFIDSTYVPTYYGSAQLVGNISYGDLNGNSLYLEGSYDYVRYDRGSMIRWMNLGAFTMSTWIHLVPGSSSHQNTIYSEWLNDGNGELQIRATTQKMRLRLFNDDETVVTYDGNFTYDYTDGWINIIFTCDESGNCAVFKDGVEDFNFTRTTNKTRNVRTYFGARADNTNEFLLGYMDEIAIWDDRRLSQEEITGIANGDFFLYPDCEVNWSCSSYGSCVNEQRECTAVTDLNSCGEEYTGDYSEFLDTSCVNVNSGGNLWRYLSTETEETPEDDSSNLITGDIVIEPEPSNFFVEAWDWIVGLFK